VLGVPKLHLKGILKDKKNKRKERKEISVREKEKSFFRKTKVNESSNVKPGARNKFIGKLFFK